MKVFSGFCCIFEFFQFLQKGFEVIRSSILTHPDLSRAREDLSRPISNICLQLSNIFWTEINHVEHILENVQFFLDFKIPTCYENDAQRNFTQNPLVNTPRSIF